jgi:hypothetical protein
MVVKGVWRPVLKGGLTSYDLYKCLVSIMNISISICVDF